MINTAMGAIDNEQSDPLINLRRAIATNNPPIPTTSTDPLSVNRELNLAIATHLYFTSIADDLPGQCLELSMPTRFFSSGHPVDLRSIYFAWLKKDVAIPDYIASTQRLNAELSSSAPGVAGGKVQNLVFVEKLDLITWLDAASDESEYIKPLASEVSAVAAGTNATVGATGGATKALQVGAAGKGSRLVDPRLMEIYVGERSLGDRNSVLRGTKPTDFSQIRKSATIFLGHSRTRNGGTTSFSSAALTVNGALVSNLKKSGSNSGRRLEPIILLSPSASSVLRMSNIKSFLDSGLYIPADSAALGGSSNTANILHLSRVLPTIDGSRPMRFILVDTPDQFKPDYWNRVVAVFTTGQTWQFKSYKWTQPSELFSRVLGIYVGWRGEEVPKLVKGWGRGVVSVQVDQWSSHQGAGRRWRDREVVEQVWGAIEENMRGRGWSKDGLPGV